MKSKVGIVFWMFLFIYNFTAAQVENKLKPNTFHTILFKVTSPKNNNISYLFGTHHAFGKSFFDTLSGANQALESCQLMIKENLDIPGHLAEDIINNRAMQTKWHKYLKSEDLAFVQSLFASSPTDFNKMTPTEMYVFLTRYFKQQVCLSKAPSDTSLSLDNYIALIAQKKNIKLIGLETTEEQIELINKDVQGMPRKIHKKRLHSIIHKIQTQNRNDCAETDWYKKMDIDYQLNKPCRNSLMLTVRNNKWMDKIRNSLETNNCFIAVGLSHLMYECGLIVRLEELGYTITPLKIN